MLFVHTQGKKEKSECEGGTYLYSSAGLLLSLANTQYLQGSQQPGRGQCPLASRMKDLQLLRFHINTVENTKWRTTEIICFPLKESAAL